MCVCVRAHVRVHVRVRVRVRVRVCVCVCVCGVLFTELKNVHIKVSGHFVCNTDAFQSQQYWIGGHNMHTNEL